MVFQKCLKYTLCLSPSCFSCQFPSGWPLKNQATNSDENFGATVLRKHRQDGPDKGPKIHFGWWFLTNMAPFYHLNHLKNGWVRFLQVTWKQWRFIRKYVIHTSVIIDNHCMRSLQKSRQITITYNSKTKIKIDSLTIIITFIIIIHHSSWVLPKNTLENQWIMKII